MARVSIQLSFAGAAEPSYTVPLVVVTGSVMTCHIAFFKADDCYISDDEASC